MADERLDIAITEKGGRVVKRSLDDIAESSRKVDTDLKSMNRTAVIAGAAIGAALTGAAVMIARGFINAAESVKETASAARQLGTTVEEFSRLDFAARSADLTTRQLRDGMEGLNRAQIQAAKGTGDQAELFRQLRISATEADGSLRPTTEVLRDLSDIFQRMPDGADKAALATKLLGAENARLIPLLNEGTAGLDAMARKSDEVGYTLSTETAKGVKDFYDELDDVKLQIDAMYREALPGLLPLLQDFASLLNSSEFKDGFNTIIQGAAQAIVWLAELATTTANVTKFLGEEIAARVGGPLATDTARVQDRIERLKETIDAVDRSANGTNFTDMFAIGNASELIPSDLISRPETVLARLREELANEENKLQFGIELNTEQAMTDAAATAQAAKDAAAAALAGPVEPPVIDWTKLGNGTNGEDGSKAAARELARLQGQLESLVSTIDPAVGAELALADAQSTFNDAIAAGMISVEAADRYMASYEGQLQDTLDPLGALTREMEKQQQVAALLGDERLLEIQLLDILEDLKRRNVVVDAAMTEQLREQLKVMQDIDKLSAAKEGMLRGSMGEGQKQFEVDSRALSELMKSGQLTGGDGFNIINQMLGGSLADTAMEMEARQEQMAEYYRRIDELRQLDVLSEQQASDAKRAIKQMEMDDYLSRTSDALGAAAGLMKSNSKEAFRVGQAAAIGQAIVNTYTAATAAYQSAAAIPYVGWLLGPAAAAGAIAAGMAQVSAIRAQQMPAYRTGGSMVVGGSGGTDSQTVAFRATPGERVSINTPAQARALERMGRDGGGGERGDFTQNVTIVQQGRPDRRTSEHQARTVRRQTQKEFERNN